MPESTDNHTERAQKTWQRRGLFTALWAAAVGFVLKKTTQVVQATGFPVQWTNSPTEQFQQFVSSPVFLGAQTNLPSSFAGNLVLDLWALDPVYNPATDALHARTTNGTAVYGLTAGTGIPVYGETGKGFAALWGTVNGNGSSVAVYGQNGSSYTGSAPGAGGFGVYGASAHGHGVVGTTSAAGAGGVVGNSAGIAGAWAGIFFGPAIVEGNFTVINGAKSAAVPHPDGSHRRLYCVESPESWFEDFGKGQLECGQADVTLDPDFAAVVHLDDYHVFLTQYGGHDDLSVSDQTPRGFRVEAKDVTASGRFSWRVVAKRKDIASPRFEPVVVPPKPEMPTIPDPPAIATPPVMRRHH